MALGVSSNGFGAQLIGSVYDALFVASIDVKDEFNKYYSVEYAHFAEYLEIRYGKTLSENDLEADHIYIVTAWLPQMIDCSYEDNKLETVLHCIKHA